MIDIETELFSEISHAIRERFGNIFVTGEFVRAPSSFPCVSLIEMNNVIVQRTMSSAIQENHSELMYEVNVYSNKAKGKKAECKEIAQFIDELLIARNFTRSMMNSIPNEGDASIYRIVARYRAVVSQDKVIYRR